MLLFKKITLKSVHEINGEHELLPADIYLTDEGDFYCELPQRLLPFVRSRSFFGRHVPFLNNKNKWCVKNSQYKEVVKFLFYAFNQTTAPKKNTERVIAFQLSAAGHFSYNIEGDVAPYPATEFKFRSTDDSRLGFYVAVQVLNRKVETADGNSEENFQAIRPQDVTPDDPAGRINAWKTSPDLDKCRIIPYSEEAALYFLNLLEGTARTVLHLSNDTSEKDQESDSVSWDNRYFIGQDADKE